MGFQVQPLVVPAAVAVLLLACCFRSLGVGLPCFAGIPELSLNHRQAATLHIDICVHVMGTQVE